MEATKEREAGIMTNGATVERTSERELVVTRTINGKASKVFRAWTEPELFKQWWAPKSFPVTLLSCEMDVRVGGTYRLEFGAGDSTFEFFGRYVDVTRPSRLVWTNDEEHGHAEGTVTTVTLEETDGRTQVVVHDLYPSKEALDEAIASGSTSGMPESLAQLDELVGSLD